MYDVLLILVIVIKYYMGRHSVIDCVYSIVL